MHRDAHFHSYALESREFVKLRISKDVPINADPINVKNSAYLNINDNLLTIRLDVVAFARERKITLICKRSSLHYFANMLAFSTIENSLAMTIYITQSLCELYFL